MEKIIDSVSIVIRTVDNREKEIPLEVWQVDAIALTLGLQVDLHNLDNVQMSSKEALEERWALYEEAVRNINGNCPH